MTYPSPDDLRPLIDTALDAANPATQAALSPLGIWSLLAQMAHHTNGEPAPTPLDLAPDASLSCSVWSAAPLDSPAGTFVLPADSASATEQIERWLSLATAGRISTLLAPLPTPADLFFTNAGALSVPGSSTLVLPADLLEFATGEYLLGATPDLTSAGLVDYAGTTVAWARLEGTSTDTFLTSAPDSALSGLDLARCAIALATSQVTPRPAASLPQGTWPGLVVRDQLLDSPTPHTYFAVKSFDVATELSLFDFPLARPRLEALAAATSTRPTALHAVAVARTQLNPTPPQLPTRLNPLHPSRAAYFYATTTLGYATLPQDRPAAVLFCGWANNPAGDPALLTGPFDEFDFTALDLDLTEAAGLYVPDAPSEFSPRVLVDARTTRLPCVPRHPRRVVGHHPRPAP
jgi:hypothetical protein